MNQLHLYILISCLMSVCLSCQAEESSDSRDNQIEPQSPVDEPSTEPAMEQTGEQSTPEVEGETAEPGDSDTEGLMDEDAEPSASVEFMALAESGDVVEFVDIERYMGTWYEIATTPSIQQRVCHGTTANYVFNETEGWVEVLNQCSVGSLEGRSQEIMGRAEVFDQNTQAKLEVIFFDQSSPYWVVGLDGSDSDSPYQWAVVSVPDKQTIWILSRTPQMSEELRQAIEQYLIDRGFPTERLIDTPQPSLP